MLTTVPKSEAPKSIPPLLNEPKQQRTRDRLERIFEVAEMLFADRGYENTSMRDIAQAVPCSMSAIYDRFGSKEVLLLAMHERYRLRTLAGIESRAPSADSVVDLHSFVPKVVGFAISVSRAHRGLRRAILAQASFNTEPATKESEFRALLSRSAFGMLLRGSAQIDHPDPRVAADFAARMIAALALQRYDLNVETQNVRLGEERFAEETARACLRYLGVPDKRRS